ncbi:helicase HerA-like domain-containing protein [Thioclava sp. GXIMD2076]|uniref:helicase HerA-like domain-containing protein n=1 Tax=Thioclava sp. GXIMD2076 TaxID=3131931 RepID=UPI0030D1CB89
MTASRPETAINTLVGDALFIGGGGPDYGVVQSLRLDKANRHGLIAGATGTGKTVTLQTLAEGFSDAGVPVFLTDVKGDLSGLAAAGAPVDKLKSAFEARAAQIGFDLCYRSYPVEFWDLTGAKGIPVRMTVSELGPVLLSRLLDLSPAQEGVLHIAFHLADEEKLALLDLSDLRAMLHHVGERASELTMRYGTVDKRSIGAIQRQLLMLESEGATGFLGEPALELADMIRIAEDGRGQVNILTADKVINTPKTYATFLLWLLSELFETLPEIGNPEKPVFVLFFDEAHLLFDDAPKPLLDKVEQVVRLIRSKGVGVYFVTQNPTDIPEDVLSQLGNRVQHALRAFTAKDHKELEQAAKTYRANPDFGIIEAIRDVGTGEAVTSFLNSKAVPGQVERSLIRPPVSLLGPVPAATRERVIDQSALYAKYRTALDRESAAELLQARMVADDPQAPRSAPESLSRGRRYRGANSPEAKPQRRSSSDTLMETFGKSIVRQIGTQGGKAIVRGILGSLFRK